MESNLVKARSTIVWILAVVCAFTAVWWIERQSGKELIARPAERASAAAAAPVLAASPDLPAIPVPRALTPQEQQWARLAWSYFEKNTDAATGLTPSVEGFHGATLWDAASSMLALIAAHDLGLVDTRGFDQRLGRILVSLERMPLYGRQLPNKAFDVRTLAMTDYHNKASATGIGWSAIDIGRLLVPLNVIVWKHPLHTPAARRLLARWDTAALVRDGELLGMQVNANGSAQAVQEGRLGYEQYAARTLALLGLDVEAAADWRRHLQLVEVEGVRICADARPQQRFGAPNFVVSEPYILTGLEFGWNRQARECAWRVYQAQERRFRRTGVPTAMSEDHVDQAPFFVYGSVWSGGRPWATVTETGEDAEALRNLSVKAAFGWHALFRTDYTSQLMRTVAPLNDPARGWYAGLYEEGTRPNKALTANTNAVVLESLAYIARGPALQYR
ncbi:MAG TPA: DUF3131 domain-containing protein [Ramlibacter sp.]|nr:DUF3131 domain-containing protein [Ramlibacter sp.]